MPGDDGSPVAARAGAPPPRATSPGLKRGSIVVGSKAAITPPEYLEHVEAAMKELIVASKFDGDVAASRVGSEHPMLYANTVVFFCSDAMWASLSTDCGHPAFHFGDVANA